MDTNDRTTAFSSNGNLASSPSSTVLNSPALAQQRVLCEEAMSLVNAGVAMQSSGDHQGAEKNLLQAVEIMERALDIDYPTTDEKDAAVRLNKKMKRYVKMIKSQRSGEGNSARSTAATSSGIGASITTSKRMLVPKHNIVDFDSPIELFQPAIHLIRNSPAFGDLFEYMKNLFGFQENNILSQKEHVVLLLTNYKQQIPVAEPKDKDPQYNAPMHDPQQNLELTTKAVTKFHAKLFTNYRKWCKYVSQTPQFSKDQLADIVLFFLIWGEASNLRQMPELLCFLYHKMSPMLARGSSESKQPGDFLTKVIRPLYNEVKKDNDKKTSKGARAPHTKIRNYDDFNEFFWTKKSLKYDIYTINEAFIAADKKGTPKIVKKTFMEKRCWLRAIRSFRRVFFFNFALFLSVLGFSLNLALVCPDSPIMYGIDLGNVEVLGKKFVVTKTGSQQLDTSENPKCLVPKLSTCLGIDLYVPGETFVNIPRDFQELIQTVPFTTCIELTSGRCKCYKDLLDNCFMMTGTAEQISPTTNKITKIKYDQSVCVPKWKRKVYSILNDNNVGSLNCNMCQLDIPSMATSGAVVNLIMELIRLDRADKGAYAMGAGLAVLLIAILLEIQNRCFSSVGIGMVGRTLSVPFGTYCRYAFFWVVLFAFKLVFDYEYMIKTLVETSMFIWACNKADYLPYSNFMIQYSQHNIIYLLFLWIPAFIVFMYDAQIFYSLLSVIYGSVIGFNKKIGEVRSFRILRLTFRSVPTLFNQKIVPNIVLLQSSKKSKKKKTQAAGAEVIRRFERVSYSQGSKPLTVKAQKYSALLEQREEEDAYSEMKTPIGEEDSASSTAGRVSNLGSSTGISGTEFERTIAFAMAWNRCLSSLREADVISDRELNVLSYLIDSKDLEGRRLYPPAFLTAGKLDESIDIITECSALYDKLKTDKKKKDKTLQKIETAMTERLVKDDLRIEAIVGGYKFSSQVLRLLLGEEHKELDECFNFMEEAVSQHTILKSLNLNNLYQCRAACADLMKSILEVPRTTSASSIKFQRALYHVIDNVENVMNSLKVVLSKQEHFVQLINDTPLKPNSFFFPGDAQHYASIQLQKISNTQAAMDIVSRAYQLLTVDNFDAEPRSDEGRRRLRFFSNSLFMDMPEAKPVREMHSFTISTPYYNEIVLYSVKELTNQNDDCIKLLFYLQTIYPFEWENFVERLGVKDMNDALKKYPEEVRLWASYRGQTLARTVRGMMYNEEAIRFLHWLEIGENEPMHLKGCSCNRCVKLNEMVALKFNYVCTCQIYGKQKDEQRQQAHDIDYLLTKHPNLRVAYVDGPKKVKDGPPKFFSVLIRALGDKIVEVYRLELPGNPILGEGKPENQNHAIIFSRGELLQCIDMNQDAYFEECLKMPNLLATVDRAPVKHPITILGFREHVFTGGVSNLASFMSIQELSFVSLGQRMLANFHVRMHYGHPDIFDKLFAMTTGGTAKATKGINLSEDIFAGFNTTLRGGRSSHEEFIQCGKGRDVGMQQLALFEAKLSSGAGECVISRDVMRLGRRLDFFRLQCWFYGNLGWYFTQSMTVFGVYFFIYGKIYMALSGMDAYFLQRGGLGIGGVLNTSWAFQLGFLLVVPVIAVVGVEKGFRHGFTYLLWNCLTLGPLFFTFQMGTRMHYFDRTLIHGGAKYRATGRGFTIKHERFAELFRFYAFSHFYRGAELAFLLVLYGIYGTFNWCNCSWRLDKDFYNNIQPSSIEWTQRCYANHFQLCVLPTNQNYGIMTFSLWIIAATWMWAPFFFNPSGLDWDKIIEDYNDWQNWLRTMNDSSESWFGWWTNELEYLEHSTKWSRFVVVVRKSRFLMVAIGIYLRLVYTILYKRRNLLISRDDKTPYILLLVLPVLMAIMLGVGYWASRLAKKMTYQQRKLRKMKFYSSFLGLIICLIALTMINVTDIFQIIMIILLVVYWFVQICIVRLLYGHVVVRAISRSYDRIVGWIVFGPLMFVAMFLPFISLFQQRVMFNNAFTSGLEVSKLFANDAAPTRDLKIKRVKKKKRDD